MATVGCIIVSYNNLPFLEQAITSALTQTLPFDEIVIADDGSSDGSRDLIQAYASGHQVIKSVLREKNMGVAANRGFAVRSCSCELITTLDGDDFFFKDKNEKEYEAINNNKDIAFSKITMISKQGEVVKHMDPFRYQGSDKVHRMTNLIQRNKTIPRDMLIPKRLYLDSGGFDPDCWQYEDWDFKIRLAAASDRWINTGIFGMAYRQTDFGISTKSPLKHFLGQAAVLFKNYKTVIKHTGLQTYAGAFLINLSRYFQSEKGRLKRSLIK